MIKDKLKIIILTPFEQSGGVFCFIDLFKGLYYRIPFRKECANDKPSFKKRVESFGYTVQDPSAKLKR